MPTITINAKATKQNDDGLLFLELEYNGRKVEMTARDDMTLLEMAQLAINQSFPPLPDVRFDGQVEITFHTDESGYRIADSAIKV